MWWVVSLLSGFSQSARNVVMKDLGHKLDEYVNVLGRFVFILPFALALTIIHGIPKVPFVYWPFSILAGLFSTIATMYLSKAFKHAEISLSVALWKISTIFVLILEIIFLHAHVTPLGAFGIFVTVVGVYLLNTEKSHNSIFQPFISLVTKQGPKNAFLAAVFIAPSIVLFKVTIDMSDPFFPAFTNYFFAVLFTLPAVLNLSNSSLKASKKYWKSFVLMGFLAFLTTIFGNIGYSTSLAANVEAVKQSEVLFAFAGGILFFKEREKIKEIWLGCSVIIIGILLVIFGS